MLKSIIVHHYKQCASKKPSLIKSFLLLHVAHDNSVLLLNLLLQLLLVFQQLVDLAGQRGVTLLQLEELVFLREIPRLLLIL